MLSKRSLKGGYKESPSLGEEVLIALLLLATTGSSSDIHSNLPEAKLDLPDTKLSLGTPLVSPVSIISAFILPLPLPLKLNLLCPLVVAAFGCK
jgi:hypothetical protein